MRDRIQSLELPKRFLTEPKCQSVEFLEHYPTSIRKRAQEYVETFKVSGGDIGGGVWSSPDIYIYGPSGSGKTFLACWVLLQLTLLDALERGGWYIKVPMLMEMLRPGWNGDTVSASRILRDALSVDLLVLDDIGVECLSPWVIERLYIIIDSRQETMRPTIYTSNLSLSELSSRLYQVDSTGLAGTRFLVRMNRAEPWVIA